MIDEMYNQVSRQLEGNIVHSINTVEMVINDNNKEIEQRRSVAFEDQLHAITVLVKK